MSVYLLHNRNLKCFRLFVFVGLLAIIIHVILTVDIRPLALHLLYGNIGSLTHVRTQTHTQIKCTVRNSSLVKHSASCFLKLRSQRCKNATQMDGQKVCLSGRLLAKRETQSKVCIYMTSPYRKSKQRDSKINVRNERKASKIDEVCGKNLVQLIPFPWQKGNVSRKKDWASHFLVQSRWLVSDGPDCCCAGCAHRSHQSIQPLV